MRWIERFQLDLAASGSWIFALSFSPLYTNKLLKYSRILVLSCDLSELTVKSLCWIYSVFYVASTSFFCW
jgi:hypothetical protein